MNTFLIYIGVAIAILVGMIFVFKPEFSMITGTKNLNSRIMSITPSGDLVLSDNTVSNINFYIEKMKTDLGTQIEEAVKKEKGEREQAINTTNGNLSSLVNDVKNNGGDIWEFYKGKIYPFKGQLEIWYQNNKSFFVDIQLIFLTAWVILFPDSKLFEKWFKDLPKRSF